MYYYTYDMGTEGQDFAQAKKWFKSITAAFEAVQELRDTELANMSDEECLLRTELLLEAVRDEDFAYKAQQISGIVEMQKIFERARKK